MPKSVREWITVLWPAFLAASALELVVFAGFDPQDVNLFGLSLEHEPERSAVYSISFLLFWLITAAAGVVTRAMSADEHRAGDKQ
jgi:hypothetical protein